VSPVHYANSASLSANATRIDAPMECKTIATHSSKVSQLSLDAKTSLLRYSMRWPLLAKVIKAMKKEQLTVNNFISSIYRHMDQEEGEIKAEAEQREAEAELRILEKAARAQAQVQGGLVGGTARGSHAPVDEPMSPQRSKNAVISYTNPQTGSFVSRSVSILCPLWCVTL
jgi:hypothetical protein